LITIICVIHIMGHIHKFNVECHDFPFIRTWGYHV